MDYGPPISSVYGIFQARILEWIAISSRGSSWPRDQICISCIGRHVLYHWATWETLIAQRVALFVTAEGMEDGRKKKWKETELGKMI